MNPQNRSNINPMLKWLWDMLSLYGTEEITVPTDFETQMNELKCVLMSDISGIVNSTLDFMINNALVNYSIETNNASLTKKLNVWMDDINGDLRGQIPTGINALAKEYLRERWKGSSLLLMRTTWENVGGIKLPTKIWFLDGANVSIEQSGTRIIGEEKYGIKIEDDKIKKLPTNKDERIFIQKPYSSWNTLYPTPFLFQRGIYKNLKILELLNTKGEKIVGKAMEYLLLMKKGSEQTALKGSPEFIYSQEDLDKAKTDFEDIISRSKNETGTPKYVTNFDTDISHIIPEYTKAINQALYSPIEKRILAGMGLIEIVEGTASSRKEGILNPKPLISEVKDGIEDFKTLMTDLIKTIIDVNKGSHRKYFTESKIEIYSSPIKMFMDKDMRDHIRSLYDRGVISMRTYVDICGEDVYFDVEKKRRAKEFADGTEELMYPHLVQNQEQHEDNRDEDNDPTEDEGKPGDKRSIEKKNYDNAGYEEAPYKKNKDLPKSVKVLPPAGQTLWRKVFNKSLPNGEDYARKVAWSVVKKTYKKDGDKWVKKGSVDRALLEEIVFSVVEEALAKKKETDKLEKASTSMEIINLKLKEKQTKLINKLLDEGEDK